MIYNHPMHILLIHQAFTAIDEPGGTRHHEFARLLADLGHEVSIIASPISYLTGGEISQKRKEDQLDKKIHIYRTYTYPALHKSFFHRLISFFSFMVSSLIQSLRVKNVDLVWGTSPPIFQAFTAWLVSRWKRVPFLLEIRDLWPAFAIAVGVLKNNLLITLSRKLENFLYTHADQIIVNSPGFVQHITEKGGKDIRVFPNGSDIELFVERKYPDNLRKNLNWEDKFVVLYAGAHGMSNDLEVVIQAAKILMSIEAIHIALLGDGKEKETLRLLSENINLTNISFLDPVPKNEIAGYLFAANTCLAILKPIELYKTTYPNKVFDYMAAGRPVILAIDGVIREVVEKANCGIFCKPGSPEAIADAVLQLHHDPTNTAQMGRNGKEYLMKYFDRKKTVRQFADMIKKITVNR
jgi:glycosyltransferase involved in cell wall biosynthesis